MLDAARAILRRSVPAEARPLNQWCVSSPRQSMVPLNGGENIGEDAPGGFGKGRLSRLEECISRGSKADWNRTSTASNHIVRVAMKAKPGSTFRRSSQKGPIRPAASMPVVHGHAAGVDVG